MASPPTLYITVINFRFWHPPGRRVTYISVKYGEKEQIIDMLSHAEVHLDQLRGRVGPQKL